MYSRGAMTTRRFVLCALAVALTANLAACGSKKKDKRKRAVPEPATESDRQGGHLKLHSNEPQYLNPVLQTRFERVNMLIYEGLVGLDARLEPVARLAASWDISESGKVIKFNLRKDVSWHDGTPFTARDVKFTYDAIRKVEQPTLWKAYFESVDSVEIIDDHTVVVVYDKPYALALVAWTVGIIPMHKFEAYLPANAPGDAPIAGTVAPAADAGTGAPPAKSLADAPSNREPVGTGPFRIARWEPGARVVLNANTKWWYGRPYLDTVEVLTNIADEDLVESLRTGKIDFAQITDVQAWINEAQLPEFQERFEVKDVVVPGFQVIAWNMTRDTFGKQKVRQALTHALNRGRVIDDVLMAQARPISAPFFANMYGADPSIAPHAFDLDKAVKLLDEAGHKSKDGRRFDIELMATESSKGPTTDGILALFRHDLAAIGIGLKVSYVTAEQFDQKMIMRDFDAAYFGWLPDVPDPDPYALLHSSQIRFGSVHAGYANPEVDRLLDEARATTDKDERKALYNKVHAIVHVELPYTPLFAAYGHYAYSRRLHGVNPNDAGAEPRFPGIARWWIGPEPASHVAKPIP